MAGDSSAFLLGDWMVKPDRNLLIRGRQEQTLQRRTMDLLVYLSQQRTPVSTEQLLATLWPDRVVADAAVHQRIAMIRKALGDDARQPAYVQTVRGRGYRIIAPIHDLLSPLDLSEPAASQRYYMRVGQFEDLSRNRSLAWLSQALTKELDRELWSWRHLASAAEHPQRTAAETMVVEGYLHEHGETVVLDMRVRNAPSPAAPISLTIATDAQDDYDKERQLASTAARFIGESLGGRPPPSNAQAYSAFLRLLNYRFYGDADENLFWLQRTLSADPDWHWGQADLAMALTRNASSARAPEMYERAWSIIQSHEFRAEAAAAACEAETWLHCFYRGDVSAAERCARRLVPSYGTPYAVVLLASGFAKEAAAYFRHRQVSQPHNPAPLEWRAAALATIGDWHGAQELTDQLATLYPAGWVNPQIIRSWSHRGTAETDAAALLCDQLRLAMNQATPGSVQQQIIAHLGYYPLAFEVALARGNSARASEIARWFDAKGYKTTAAIFELRARGTCSKALARQAPDQILDGFWWWLTRLHIRQDIADHPVIRHIERKLGYSKAWQQELAQRAAALPQDHQINVAANAEPAW